MVKKPNQLQPLIGAVTLGAGIIAISLAPLPVFAQTSETQAFEVARETQSADAALDFINRFPSSPLAVELVQALPTDVAQEVCVQLPENVSQELTDACTEILNVLPAAGPLVAAAPPAPERHEHERPY